MVATYCKTNELRRDRTQKENNSKKTSLIQYLKHTLKNTSKKSYFSISIFHVFFCSLTTFPYRNIVILKAITTTPDEPVTARIRSAVKEDKKIIYLNKLI